MGRGTPPRKGPELSGGDQISLANLVIGSPALTAARAHSLAEAASFCLAECGHGLAPTLFLAGTLSGNITLKRLEVTDAIRRCYADHVEAVEQGACGAHASNRGCALHNHCGD